MITFIVGLSVGLFLGWLQLRRQNKCLVESNENCRKLQAAVKQSVEIIDGLANVMNQHLQDDKLIANLERWKSGKSNVYIC